MTEEKPVVYVLRGDDREGIEAHLQNFYASLGNPDAAEMNATRLDGKSASLNDLRTAALALPFLAQRRLVILEDALHPYQGRGTQKEREAFLALLDSLPQTTGLVLIIPDTKKYRRGRTEWEQLNGGHWLVKWVQQAGSYAMMIDCLLPAEGAMADWILKKAKELDGSFTPQAAHLLADYVGNHTQRATQEIIKLLTYKDFSQPVEAEDVSQLTEQDRQTDIFTMVDAIGRRDSKEALKMFHLLLEEQDLLQIFSMIIRQFRLLLQTREIIDQGGNEGDVAKLLGQHPFVAKKITAQSRQFDLETLAAIYRRLLIIDLDNKTGKMPGDTALDLLIAQLAQ